MSDDQIPRSRSNSRESEDGGSDESPLRGRDRSRDRNQEEDRDRDDPRDTRYGDRDRDRDRDRRSRNRRFDEDDEFDDIRSRRGGRSRSRGNDRYDEEYDDYEDRDWDLGDERERAIAAVRSAGGACAIVFFLFAGTYAILGIILLILAIADDLPWGSRDDMVAGMMIGLGAVNLILNLLGGIGALKARSFQSHGWGIVSVVMGFINAFVFGLCGLAIYLPFTIRLLIAMNNHHARREFVGAQRSRVRYTPSLDEMRDRDRVDYPDRDRD